MHTRTHTHTPTHTYTHSLCFGWGWKEPPVFAPYPPPRPVRNHAGRPGNIGLIIQCTCSSVGEHFASLTEEFQVQDVFNLERADCIFSRNRTQLCYLCRVGPPAAGISSPWNTIDGFHSIFHHWNWRTKCHVMWILTNLQVAWWCNALQMPSEKMLWNPSSTFVLIFN